MSVESQRIVKVETGLAALTTEFHSFKDDIRGDIRSLAGSIEGISKSSKTNWQTIAAWTSVVLVMGTIIGSVIMRDIIRLEHNSHENHNELIKHEKSAGHFGVHKNESDIEKLDQKLTDSLRYEVRILNNRINEIWRHEESRKNQ